MLFLSVLLVIHVDCVTGGPANTDAVSPRERKPMKVSWKVLVTIQGSLETFILNKKKKIFFKYESVY